MGPPKTTVPGNRPQPMDIAEKANSGGDRDIVLARDSAGVYRIESTELELASEIGTSDFPQYGSFLSCTEALGDKQPVYLEAPQGLAQILDENNADVGTVLRIESSRKSAGGRWVFQAQVGDDLASVGVDR